MIVSPPVPIVCEARSITGTELLSDRPSEAVFSWVSSSGSGGGSFGSIVTTDSVQELNGLVIGTPRFEQNCKVLRIPSLVRVHATASECNACGTSVAHDEVLLWDGRQLRYVVVRSVL